MKLINLKSLSGAFVMCCALSALPAFAAQMSRQEVIGKFNDICYDDQIYAHTTWLGIPMYQNPCDVFAMQELIAEIRPEVIIETGTYHGGSTLFYAMILDQINPGGKIISVDIDPKVGDASKFKIFRDKVEVLTGSSTAPEIIEKIRNEVRGRRALVTLDSDHSKKHVLNELRLYSEFVSVGSYLVVQDTNVDLKAFSVLGGPGPLKAVEEFLKEDPRFEVDASREKFLLTFYPSGFLKRIK